MTWLAETPEPLVRAHVRMLPRLQAEESLRRATEVSVGAGHLETAARDRVVRAWEDQAAAFTPALTRGAPATPAALAAIGIHTKRVRRG